MQYPTAASHSYLTTELAEGLAAAGHSVEVLHLDWHGEPRCPTEELVTIGHVRVVRCSARSLPGFGPLIGSASKFLLSGRRAARVASTHFDLAKFDVAIAWMPASAIAPLVKLLRRAGIPNRLLFIWDFFPDHHYEIGRIRGRAAMRIAHSIEQYLLKEFTAIICTLPSNADYLQARFHVRPDQRVLVTPIWGETGQTEPIDRSEVRSHHSLPQGAPIAIFGGQLVEGRGFEQMLGASDSALKAGSNLHFLFVGDGRLAPMIRERAKEQANVLYLPSISRSDYLELLGACDVGMVATVPGVSSFSIPSKTIDYLRAGLPIVAALEPGNDYLQILDRYHVGAGVPFGQAQLFFEEAERLAARGSVKEAAARCLEEIFDVRHAIAAIIEASDQT